VAPLVGASTIAHPQWVMPLELRDWQPAPVGARLSRRGVSPQRSGSGSGSGRSSDGCRGERRTGGEGEPAAHPHPGDRAWDRAGPAAGVGTVHLV